jgi:hypothetical protein
MIGSIHHGNMSNNEVEGWVGYTISEIAQKAELSLPSKPNVVLINVGSKAPSTSCLSSIADFYSSE